MKVVFRPKTVRFKGQTLLYTFYTKKEVITEDGRKRKQDISNCLALNPHEVTEVPDKVGPVIMEKYEGIVITEEEYIEEMGAKAAKRSEKPKSK